MTDKQIEILSTRTAILASLPAVPVAVVLYAWFTFGTRLIGKPSLANAPELVSWWEVIASAVIASVIPALVYSAVSAVAHRHVHHRAWRWGVLALAYASCWLIAAWLVAGSFAPELGATWLPSEILFELVLARSWAWVSLCAGLLLSSLTNWALAHRQRCNSTRS